MSNVVKKEFSPTEILNRYQEQKRKAYLSIVKDTLVKHKEFAKLKENFAKLKRYVNEAETLLTNEGFDKASTRIDEKIAELQAEREQLTAKRNTATAVINDLRSRLESQETLHVELGKAIMKEIEGNEAVLTDEAKLSDVVTKILSAHNTSEEVKDPFENYRS